MPGFALQSDGHIKVNLSETPIDIPDRLPPPIVMTAVNERFRVASGPLRLLCGEQAHNIAGELAFEWYPTLGLVFAGECEPSLDFLGNSTCRLQLGEAETPLLVDARVVNSSIGPDGNQVRGIVSAPVSIGQESFASFRFGLVNFPEFFGDPFSFHNESGSGWVNARTECSSDRGTLRFEAIPELRSALPDSERAQGFLVTHVGEWTPSQSAPLSLSEVERVRHLLQLWFAFLRGGWAGPVLLQGIDCEMVVWRQFSRWKLSEPGVGQSWLPCASRLRLGDLFRGFEALFDDPKWTDPLRLAISWLVEANGARSLESRLVLSQVGLELLSWVHIVETAQLHSRSDFDKLSAAGRIRTLLHSLRIPTVVPSHLSDLERIPSTDIADGPGVITSIRNALVHSTEKNRRKTETLDTDQLWACSQLSLQYVELVLLALCGYGGRYSRRGWKGWRGEDEAVVPWAAA